MIRIFWAVSILSLASGLISCRHSSTDQEASQSISLPADSAPNEAPALSSGAVRGMTHEQTELKLARLWSRVDELETKMIRQQEKLKLLEQGLMLGIIPEGLHSRQDTEASASSSSWVDHIEEPVVTPEVRPARNQPQAERSDRAYQELLSQAQAKFGAGRYGQAIADYQKIHEMYPEHTQQGQHLYWIGLGWYYLKEDDLAAENLEKLVTNHQGSSWLPQASFYLAKVDLRRGLRQKGLQRLRQVVEQFGDKDVAEMARFELAQLQESL